jgi:hypothetical protein
MDLGSETKRERPAVKMGYLRKTVTWRALYKRRERQGMRIETNPDCPATQQPDGRSVTGCLPDSLLARAEHLAQFSTSFALFATACLRQGIFLYCASTYCDGSVFHGRGYLDRRLFTDTISATWVI